MAYRRALSVPSTLLARRFSPLSFTYISHHDRSTNSEELRSFGSNQRRSLVSYAFRPTPYGLAGNAMYMSLRRGISTSSPEATQGAASAFKAIIAATDSTYPVAAAQYLIDYVHTLTGLNWWASIAVATLLVRGALVPVYIKLFRKIDVQSEIEVEHQIVPLLRQMRAARDRDPVAEETAYRKVMDIVQKGGISPLLFPFADRSMKFSFFFAVMNMAEKVPSFKTGGALWFTDLSTPDTLYIFPISMTLLTLFQLEILSKKKKPVTITGDPFLPRALAVLWIPLTMFLPNAVFCFWIPSRISVICFREVTKDPRVQKALRLIGLELAPPLKSSTDKRNK